MSHDRVQEAEQLATANELGGLQKVYTTTAVTILKMGFSLLLGAVSLFLLFGFGVFSESAVDRQEKLLAMLIAIGGLLFCFPLAWSAYRSRADKEWLYEGGLILQRSSGLQAIRWEQVQSTQHHYHHHEMGAASVYQLQLRDGQTIRLLSSELFNRIQQHVGR